MAVDLDKYRKATDAGIVPPGVSKDATKIDLEKYRDASKKGVVPDNTEESSPVIPPIDYSKEPWKLRASELERIREGVEGTGPINSFVSKAAQALSLGWGDELAAYMMTQTGEGKDRKVQDVDKKTGKPIMRNMTDEERRLYNLEMVREIKRYQDMVHPRASTAGTMTGVVGGIVAPGMKALQAAQGVKAAALGGGFLGGLYGAGEAEGGLVDRAKGFVRGFVPGMIGGGSAVGIAKGAPMLPGVGKHVQKAFDVADRSVGSKEKMLDLMKKMGIRAGVGGAVGAGSDITYQLATGDEFNPERAAASGFVSALPFAVGPQLAAAVARKAAKMSEKSIPRDIIAAKLYQVPEYVLKEIEADDPRFKGIYERVKAAKGDERKWEEFVQSLEGVADLGVALQKRISAGSARGFEELRKGNERLVAEKGPKFAKDVVKMASDTAFDDALEVLKKSRGAVGKADEIISDLERWKNNIRADVGGMDAAEVTMKKKQYRNIKKEMGKGNIPDYLPSYLRKKIESDAMELGKLTQEHDALVSAMQANDMSHFDASYNKDTGELGEVLGRIEGKKQSEFEIRGDTMAPGFENEYTLRPDSEELKKMYMAFRETRDDARRIADKIKEVKKSLGKSYKEAVDHAKSLEASLPDPGKTLPSGPVPATLGNIKNTIMEIDEKINELTVPGSPRAGVEVRALRKLREGLDKELLKSGIINPESESYKAAMAPVAADMQAKQVGQDILGSAWGDERIDVPGVGKRHAPSTLEKMAPKVLKWAELRGPGAGEDLLRPALRHVDPEVADNVLDSARMFAAANDLLNKNRTRGARMAVMGQNVGEAAAAATGLPPVVGKAPGAVLGALQDYTGGGETAYKIMQARNAMKNAVNNAIMLIVRKAKNEPDKKKRLEMLDDARKLVGLVAGIAGGSYLASDYIADKMPDRPQAPYVEKHPPVVPYKRFVGPEK